MPRPCSVCNHSQTLEIDRLLAKRVVYREITAKYGVSDSSIDRHVKNCIPSFLEAARATQKQKSGIVVEDEINHVFRRLNKLLEVCDEWLTDPEDASKYSLDARASELSVVYHDFADLTERGKPKRKRAHLSDLLRRLEESAKVEPVSVLIKRADPRDLIVRTAGEIKNQLELFARLQGLFQRDRANEHDTDLRQEGREEALRLLAEYITACGGDEAQARRLLAEDAPTYSGYLM